VLDSDAVFRDPQTGMRIIRETAGPETARALDQAWSAPETFALLPTKTSLTAEWVEQALGAIPLELQSGHFCLFTSGSTGDPKMVVGERRRSEKLACVLHAVQDSEPVKETIGTLPLSYCFAFVNQWLWSRVSQRKMIQTHGLGRPDLLLEVLAQAQHAMLCLVGAQVPTLMEHCAGRCFPGIIRIHFAGGRFPQERLLDLARVFPSAEIFNNYGCAEAMPRLTIRRAGEAEVAANIGRPIPGVELATDDSFALVFRSSYRAVAQLENGVFRRITEEEWVPTGDLGHRLPTGDWELQGRANEVFKRYGEKIAIPQILTMVNRQWRGSALLYRETDAMGEEGVVLVLSPGPTESHVRALLQAFRKEQPRSHWPLRIESVAAIPTLPNGKPDGKALRQSPGLQVHWRQRI
jgi:acyl-CoA synthetase (AMP-forming)/AMP-acid ligase II